MTTPARLTTDLDALPDALAHHPYGAFLGQLQKPGRYLGGEEQQVVKDHAGLTCRFVLAFPDLYEVGMSHLGTRIIYDLVNGQEDLVCERAFSPWFDLEHELRQRGLPLVSLESHRPLRQFDVVGVSLQYELSYSNVLLNLELGGIPLRTVDRGEDDPIVLGGGPTATHPEPIAPFLDAVVVGEAEEVLPQLLRVVGRMRAAGRPRAEVLAALARTPGVYVPSLYAVEDDERTGFRVIRGPTQDGEAAGAPPKVRRVWVRDLNAFPFPDRFPVPYAEAIFDRAAVEITRGCTEGCRFCQAGMIYRPVRERSPEQVVDAVLNGVENAGYADTSLTALSTADVSCIDPLIKELVPRLVERNVSLGVASLRAYGLEAELLDEIKRVGINGLTFAPEAGTQRMRDVINKNVSEEDILASARRIFERGYDRMKIYFIMGLPTETDEDVAGIVETGRRCREVASELGLRRMPTITVSVSQHVPKPHTPFQWAAMDAMEDLESKCQMLRGLAKQARVQLRTHDVRESWLECLFARGDRRMADVLETAYRAGARFDGWREGFDFSRWLDALQAHDVRPEVYTRTIPVDARVPWDHVDVGLDPGFLADEWRKAIKGRVSPPCGKPFGAKVHHRSRSEAENDDRRLVCYDCGVACDMTQMREERIDALRHLSGMTEARQAREAAAGPVPDVLPAALTGRLARSNLAVGSAFKANAEAPHSRLRVVFAKRGALRFLGHLDLVRTLPRMFRRAGVELGFTRGYNPQPRMTFTPALPLGMAADAEIVDVEVVLERSADDMTGALADDERAALSGELARRLAAAAPPGLVVRSAELLPPGAARLGKLVAAADYSVELDTAQLDRLEAGLSDRLAATELFVTRTMRPKKRKRGRSSAHSERAVDVRRNLVDARADRDAGLLRFRIRLDQEGGARPREVVEALLGEAVPDPRFRRERLLAAQGDELVALA